MITYTTKEIKETMWQGYNDVFVRAEDVRKALIKISEEELIENPPIIAINKLIDELSKGDTDA